VLLLESADTAQGNAAYLKALERVAATVQLTNVQSAYGLGILLELIAANTPPLGFVKILGHLDRWEFSIDYEDPGEQKRLRELALYALQQYYPVAPPEENSAFKSYVGFLNRKLDDPRFRSHCIRRLIELRKLQLDDSLVAEALSDQQSGALDELVRAALGPRKNEGRNWLGAIFAHCMTNQTLPRLESVLNARGATIVHLSNGVGIRLSNGVLLELLLPPNVEHYMWMRWTDVERQGLQKLASFEAINWS
jgi:hypothetical protein